jgi:hypothetical protein
MTLTPNESFAQHGLRRALRAGTGALALSLLAAGCSGGAGGASQTGSGVATAAPTTSSSAPVDVPLVVTVHDGFFPIPQADAKVIPWDKVGPGWFLVDSHASTEVQLNDSGDPAPIPEAVGGLSLVSPEGQWFAARSYAGTGASNSLHWAPNGVWLMTSAMQSIEDVSGDVVRVDLATGARTSVSKGDFENRAYTSAVGGVTVVDGYSQDAVGPFIVYGASGAASPACVQNVRRDQGDLRSFLAPDGLRVVCWGSRSDNKTDVEVVNVQNPTTMTKVDTFRLDPYSYYQLGWLAPDTFLMARVDAASQKDTFFAYDVSTKKIADYALPFAPDAGQRLGAHDYAAKVFITSDSSSDTLEVYRDTGEKIATVAAGCADGGASTWALSGANMLVTCQWAAGQVTIVNLETGATVGTWADPPGRELQAYGYPQHAK